MTTSKRTNCVYCKSKKNTLFVCEFGAKRDLVCSRCVTQHSGQFKVVGNSLTGALATFFGWFYSGDVSFFEHGGAWYRFNGDLIEMLVVRDAKNGARLYHASVWLDLYFNERQIVDALRELDYHVSDDFTQGAFQDGSTEYLSYAQASQRVFLQLADYWGFGEELCDEGFFTDECELFEKLRKFLIVSNEEGADDN